MDPEHSYTFNKGGREQTSQKLILNVTSKDYKEPQLKEFEVEYSNGDKYKGYFKNGLRHGYGEMTYGGSYNVYKG